MFFKNLIRKRTIHSSPRNAATAILPMKIGETEATECIAEPLRTKLIATGLGNVLRHRLHRVRGGEPTALEIDLELASSHPRALEAVGSMLDDMDAPVGSTIEFTETGLRHQFGRTEGVAIELDPDAEWLDFAEAAVETLGGAASYQGSRMIGGRRRLYFYGENATNIASTIKAAAQLDRRIGHIEARRLT